MITPTIAGSAAEDNALRSWSCSSREGLRGDPCGGAFAAARLCSGATFELGTGFRQRALPAAPAPVSGGQRLREMSDSLCASTPGATAST